MVQFAYTILYVQDVQKSIAFYEAAFGLSRKFVTPDSDYAELLCGPTTLAFASTKLAASNLSDGFLTSRISEKPFGIEIGFTTEQVAETVSTALTAGATLAEAPKLKPWGQSVAYLRDPDGFLIEICTPMAAG